MKVNREPLHPGYGVTETVVRLVRYRMTKSLGEFLSMADENTNLIAPTGFTNRKLQLVINLFCSSRS